MMPRLRPLLALLWRGHRRDALQAAGLLAALAFTEGVGLLSVLPALQAVGIPIAGAAGAGRVADAVRVVLSWAGLTPSVGPALGLVVLLIALRAGVQMAQARVAARLETDVVRGLRVRIFSAVLELPWGRFTGERPAALMHAVGPQVDDVHSALLLFLQISAQVATALAAVVVAALLSPWVTAVVCAAGVLLFGAARVLRMPGRRAGDALLESSSQVLVRGAELLGAAKMLKAWGAEGRATAVFARDVDAWAVLSRRVAGERARATFGLTVLSAGLLALLSAAAIGRQMAPGALLLLLLIYARLLPRLADLQHSASYFWQVSSAVASVTELLERLVPEAGDGIDARVEGPGSSARDAAGAAPPRIEVRHVTVRYAASAAPALVDFSATFPAGALTVVMGASGAGKTTLGDLMFGLLSPAAGNVTLDGQPLGEALAQGWHARVGYLAQEPMLFHGTIRENLRFARPSATDAELRAALHDAACDFVDALPQGLDAPVGDRGVLLSGGERQRIALARALLRQPGLLVLDEATSALDAETEARILQTVRALRGRCTVVFCTHRAAVRAAADQVIEL